MRSVGAQPQASVIRTAVVPDLTMSRPVLRRGQERRGSLRGSELETPEERVMRGRDLVSLVAMLLWWRTNVCRM